MLWKFLQHVVQNMLNIYAHNLQTRTLDMMISVLKYCSPWEGNGSSQQTVIYSRSSKS